MRARLMPARRRAAVSERGRLRAAAPRRRWPEQAQGKHETLEPRAAARTARCHQTEARVPLAPSLEPFLPLSIPAATQPCAWVDLPAARVPAGPRAGWSVPGPARLPFAPAALSMLCSDLWYCPVLRWSGRVCGAADLLHQRRPFVPRVLKLSLPPLRSWPQLRLPSTVYYYGLLLPPGRILACPPVALLAGAPQHARVLLVAPCFHCGSTARRAPTSPAAVVAAPCSHAQAPPPLCQKTGRCRERLSLL
jgi:hypothetical protein